MSIMKKYEVKITDKLVEGGISLNGRCAGDDVRNSVIALVKKNCKAVSKALGGFGFADVVVTDCETGEVLSSGSFECNVFTGVMKMSLI